MKMNINVIRLFIIAIISIALLSACGASPKSKSSGKGKGGTITDDVGYDEDEDTKDKEKKSGKGDNDKLLDELKDDTEQVPDGAEQTPGILPGTQPNPDTQNNPLAGLGNEIPNLRDKEDDGSNYIESEFPDSFFASRGIVVGRKYKEYTGKLQKEDSSETDNLTVFFTDVNSAIEMTITDFDDDWDKEYRLYFDKVSPELKLKRDTVEMTYDPGWLSLPVKITVPLSKDDTWSYKDGEILGSTMISGVKESFILMIGGILDESQKPVEHTKAASTAKDGKKDEAGKEAPKPAAPPAK